MRCYLRLGTSYASVKVTYRSGNVIFAHDFSLELFCLLLPFSFQDNNRLRSFIFDTEVWD
jgi:hypothetical protein